MVCKEQPAGDKQAFRYHDAVRSPEIVMHLSHSSVDAPNADLPIMRIYAWVSLWHWSNPIVTTDPAFQPAYMPCIAQCKEDLMPPNAKDSRGGWIIDVSATQQCIFVCSPQPANAHSPVMLQLHGSALASGPPCHRGLRELILWFVAYAHWSVHLLVLPTFQEIMHSSEEPTAGPGLC